MHVIERNTYILCTVISNSVLPNVLTPKKGCKCYLILEHKIASVRINLHHGGQLKTISLNRKDKKK